MKRASLTIPWESNDADKPSFGLEMRKAFDNLSFDQVTFCNQGSYGVSPTPVIKYKHDIVSMMDSYPDEFFRNTSRSLYDESLKTVANFLGSDVKNLVFVSNVTTGINTVLKGLEFEPESEILHTNHTYPSTRYTIDEVATRYDADILSMDLPLPIKDTKEIVKFYENFPVAEIAAALKKFNIIVIVDGAHAPGQVPLNLEELGRSGVDFYTGNLHKWGYAPRGCGVLWCHPKYEGRLRPLVTSNLYHGTFQDQFFYQGTQDISNYIAAAGGVRFHRSIGSFDAMYSYISPMLARAQTLIVEALGTKKLEVPEEMEAPFMRCIEMPHRPPFLPITLARADLLTIDLMKDSNVVAAFTTFNGKMFIRISGSVFNVDQDYEVLKEALVKMMSKN